MAELYHYTTGAGLLGMLKDYDAEKNPNLTMWATHYAYMNDPTEFEYGIEICLPLIKEIEEEEKISAEDRIYPFLAKNHGEWGILEIKYPEYRGLVNPYIISFSQTKDSLHMWNMYGQNGNGLALCFDSEKLRQDRTLYLFDSCAYINSNEEKQSDAQKQEVKKKLRTLYYTLNSINLPTNNGGSNDSKDITNSRVFFFSVLLFACVASFIKNNAYTDEREYRMLSYGKKKENQFRERNGEIIPYTENVIPFDALTNIIVGPTRDFERTRNSILLLLGQKGISWSPDKIIKSNVPYRG